VPTAYYPFVKNGALNPEFTGSNYEVHDPVSGIRHSALLVAGKDRGGINVQVPPGTAFLCINGTAAPGLGALRVKWNQAAPELDLALPPDPVKYAGRPEGYLAPANASRPFISVGELLYYAVLDPRVAYSFQVGPIDEPGHDRVSLHSVTFYAGR
jgi:hypothetical protein